MNVFALTGADTIQIGGRVLKNFGDGDVGAVKFPNKNVNVKRGKNGNAVFALNATGRLAEVSLRIIRGSPDDVFLNAESNRATADLPSYSLLEGYFVKRIGDGSGRVVNDTYLMRGGVVDKIPEAVDNVEGGTDAGLVMYSLTFGDAKRANM